MSAMHRESIRQVGNVSLFDVQARLEYFKDSEGELRLLQPIWNLRLGNEDLLISPLFPIVLSMLYFFGSMVPWMIIDLYGQNWKWIVKYKIQPEKEVTWPLIKRAIILTVWNHVLYLLPVSMAQWVWTADTPLPADAPGVWPFFWHQFCALVIFDFEYYVWHAVHHKFRFLYRHIHGLHHEYHAPSSWVTQYLHPFELVSVGIFTTTSPWLFDAHPLTQWAFMIWCIFISVDAHIGYDLPFMPHNWCPIWGGAIKHDMHHQKPLTNFQPFFNFWDKLMGTECPGQMAGGYKPKKLVDFEKKRALEQKERIRRWEAKNAEEKKVHMATYIDDDEDEDLEE